MRILGQEAVPGRGMGLGDGVVFAFVAMPPAVQDAQDDGAGVRGVVMPERVPENAETAVTSI